MANMKVVVEFIHEGRQFRVGDILSVSSKSDQLHLIKTGQAIYETYDFVNKEEKTIKVKTKELKVEVETKEEDIDVLREKYLDKFNKEADKRWKESRLLEELNND
jgi:3'-phosphoadenosine 5'-phosphosulfate sulfotransferase (PAPS reductase)/FAD synthetase